MPGFPYFSSFLPFLALSYHLRQPDFPYVSSFLPLLALSHHPFPFANFTLLYHKVQTSPYMIVFRSIHPMNKFSIWRFMCFLKHILFCTTLVVKFSFFYSGELLESKDYSLTSVLHIRLLHSSVATSVHIVHTQNNFKG